MTLSAHHCAGLNQQEGRDVQAALALLIRKLAKGRAGKRRSTCEWPRQAGGLNLLHIFSLQDEPTNATGGTCGWPYSSVPCWHCKCLSLGRGDDKLRTRRRACVSWWASRLLFCDTGKLACGFGRELAVVSCAQKRVVAAVSG